MKRLLYGGTFDPIHIGHVHVANRAGRLLGAERVVLIPTGSPPHKGNRTHAGGAQRLEMVRRAVQDEPLLEVNDSEVSRPGTSYTIDTVEALLAGPYAGDSLVVLLGQDALEILPDWHRIEDLTQLVAFAFVPRPGAPEPDWKRLETALGPQGAASLRALRLAVPPMDVSSSDLRDRRATGRSVRCRVPDPVADFIEENDLYLEPTSPSRNEPQDDEEPSA